MTEVIEGLNTKILEHETTMATHRTTIENLLNKNCPVSSELGIEIVDPSKVGSDLGIRILIDMDTAGNYTIKNWVDPNQDYEIDGMILEFFKDENGTLEIV
jgi:hypothetical protein